MPLNDSPFGSLPTNLPQIAPLPMPAPAQARQPQMPMPDVMAPVPMQQMPQQRSELESIISGITGLVKQRRDEAEKKKSGESVKALMDQLAALKASREAGAESSDRIVGNASNNTLTGSARMDGVPADMDDYMARNAKFESGADENAVNAGSGATGLFQFLPSTWNWIAKEAPELGLTPEGMKSRDQQMKAMRYYTDKSARTLEPILGRKPTGGELYLLHLLGHSGGPAVLADLDAPITKTISEGAYRGNPFLRQYGTGRDLIAGLNSRFGGTSSSPI